MKKAARPNLISRVLYYGELFVSVLMLAYCARVLADFLRVEGLWVTWGLYLMLMPVMYLLRYVLALVHEAGHMLGGWLSGLRFYSISVAGWSLVRRGGTLRWGYDATPGAAGLCAMVADKSPRPYACHILGGPLATLLLGGVCAYLAACVCGPQGSGVPGHILLTILAVEGIAAAVTNLIPQRYAGGMNDGMQLWLLSRDAGCREAWEQGGRIAWAEYQGLTRRDMPEALFAHPPIARDMNPYAADLAMQRLARLLGQRDFAAALALCHELLEAEVAFSPMQLLSVVRTGALCEAMLDGPGLLCRRMQDRDMVRLMQYSGRTRGTLLCWYAMAKLVSRNEALAAQHRASYARAAARSPHRESVKADSELLRLIDERAEALVQGEKCAEEA